MATATIIGVVCLVLGVAGWYLFESRWDRRIFSHGRRDRAPFTINLRARKASELLDQSDPPVTIDVRPADDFRRGALPGAHNIPFAAPDFEGRMLNQFDRDDSLLIYCSGGFRGRQAVERLRDLGYSQLYHLHRGIGSWRLAGFSVEKPETGTA